MLYTDEEKQDSSINTPLVDTSLSKPLGQDDSSYNKYYQNIKQNIEQQKPDKTLENKYYASIKSNVLQEQERNQAIVHQNLALASLGDADREAEIQRLAKESRTTPDLVRGNFEQIQRLIQLKKIDAKGLSASSPILARQLEDPAFAALAYDDLEVLTKWENVADNIKQIPKSAAAGLFMGESMISNTLAGGFGFLAESLEAWGADSPWFNAAADFFEEHGKDATAMSEFVQGDMRRFSPSAQALYDGFKSFGALAPTMMSTFASGGVNALPTILTMAGMIGTGEGVQTARAEGLAWTTSLIHGLSSGAVEVGTEAIPMGRFLKSIKLDESWLKTLAVQLGYEIPQEQVATVLQSMNNFLHLPSQRDKTWGEFLEDRPAEAWHTLLATITGTGAQTTTFVGLNKIARRYGQGIEVDPFLQDYINNSQKVKSAEDALKLLNEMTQAVNESKTQERSIDTAKNYIKTLFQSKTEEEMPNDVLIEANELVVLAQEHNINLNEIPIIQEQLQEAIDTGGFISIPIEDYFTQLANQEFGPQLNELVRLHEDAWSVREAGEWTEEADQRLIERADVIIQNLPDQEQAEQIFDQIVEQLVEAGEPRVEANKSAELYRAFFAVLADRTDVDMLELYERYGLKVTKVMDDVGVETPAQITLLADLILAPKSPLTETVETETPIPETDPILENLVPETDPILEVPAPIENELGISEEQLDSIRTFLTESGMDLANTTPEEVISAIQKAMYSPEGQVLSQKALESLSNIIDEAQPQVIEGIQITNWNKFGQKRIEADWEKWQQLDPDNFAKAVKETGADVNSYNKKEWADTLNIYARKYHPKSQQRIKRYEDKAPQRAAARARAKQRWEGKATFSDYVKVLEVAGFKQTYSSRSQGNGVSDYFEKDGITFRVSNHEMVFGRSSRDYMVAIDEIKGLFQLSIPNLGQQTNEPLTREQFERFVEIVSDQSNYVINDINDTRSDIEKVASPIVQSGINSVNVRTLFQSAFHGTGLGEIFDQFSTDFIGTGEGFQSFGWGLYFTDKQSLAEHYKKKNSRGRLTIDGRDAATDGLELVAVSAINAHGYDGAIKHEEERLELYKEGLNFKYTSIDEIPYIPERNIKEAVYPIGGDLPITEQRRILYGDIKLPEIYYNDKYLGNLYDKNVRNLIDSFSQIQQEQVRKDVKEVEDTIKIIKSLKGKEIAPAKGKVYQVELMPQDDEWLLWDEVLEHQSEKVQKIINSLPKRTQRSLDDYELRNNENMSGETFYKAIADMQGLDKAASLYLHALGIKGIKFANGNTRNSDRRRVKILIDGTKTTGIVEDEAARHIIDYADFIYSDGEINVDIAIADAIKFLEDWIKDFGTEGIEEKVLAKLEEWQDDPTQIEIKDGIDYNFVVFNDEDIEITKTFNQGANKPIELKKSLEPAKAKHPKTNRVGFGVYITNYKGRNFQVRQQLNDNDQPTGEFQLLIEDMENYLPEFDSSPDYAWINTYESKSAALSWVDHVYQSMLDQQETEPRTFFQGAVEPQGLREGEVLHYHSSPNIFDQFEIDENRLGGTYISGIYSHPNKERVTGGDYGVNTYKIAVELGKVGTMFPSREAVKDINQAMEDKYLEILNRMKTHITGWAEDEARHFRESGYLGRFTGLEKREIWLAGGYDTVKDGGDYISLHPEAVRILEVNGKPAPPMREFFQSAKEPTLDEFISQKQINNAVEDDKWRNWKPKLDKNGKPIGSAEWVKNTKDLTKQRKFLRQLLVEGLSGRYWYEQSALGVLEAVKGDVVEAEKFIQLLAIYSAHTEVWVNTMGAVKAYSMWKNNVSEDEFHVATGEQDKKAIDLLYNNKAWSGRKTNTFYQNLMYEIVRINPKALSKLSLDEDLVNTLNKGATIDLWMYRAFGYKQEAGGDDKGLGKYSFAENETRRLTARLNKELKEGEDRWTPHQVQAAIWAAMRTRYNFPEVKAETTKKSINKKLTKVVKKDGKKKLVFPAKGKEKDQHYAIWRKEAMKVSSEAVIKEAEPNDASFAVQLNKMTKHVTWEAIPSPSLNHDILNASPEMQQRFTQEAKKIILDDNGNDLIAELLNIPLNWDSVSRGAYMGEISPNVITRLIPIKPEGDFTYEDVRTYAQAIQYIFKQDAVPWFRPDPTPLSKSANQKQRFRVFKISTGRTVSGGVVETLAEAQAIVKEKGKDFAIKGGKFSQGIAVRFKNNLTTAQLEKVVKLTKIGDWTQTATNEITIINFRDDKTGIPFVDDEVFLDQINETFNQHGKKLKVHRLGLVYTEGEYGYENNWKNNKTGQKLLNRGALSRRSDLHPRLRGWSKEFETLLEDYSGENLKLREEEQTLEKTLKQEERGSIQFRSSETIISLFEGSDRSTFLHESGHFFLQVVQDLAEDPNPPKGIAKDWETILNYLGVEKGSEIGVEEHEKWARAFESYLFEGKAPSVALHGAFARFKAWLKSVYRQAINLNVEINDDIRGVFDRLLATKEEIQQAKEVANHVALFKTAAEAGMTDAQFKAYKVIVDDSDREAEAELDHKKLVEVVLMDKKEYKEEQEKVRLEVENEVNAMNVYQLIHYLQTGEMLDGSPKFPEHHKLNTKLLKQEFGPDILGLLHKGRYAIHEKDGVHHDDIASMFGYSSGRKMINDMRDAVPRKLYIKQLTTTRMEEKRGALYKDEQKLKQEAIKANYVSKQLSRMLQMESKFLAKLSGKSPEALAAKQVAKDIIAKRLITNFQIGKFRQAAETASRRSQRAMFKKDFAEAQKQKDIQILNFHLYKEAVLAQEKVEKIVKHLEKFKKLGTRKNIEQDYLDRIDHVLELYDLKKSVSQKALAKRKTFAAWLAEQDAVGNKVVITKKMQTAIENATKKHYKEMTFEELEELDDFVKNLEHLGRRHQKLLNAKNAREMAELIQDMIHTTHRELGPAKVNKNNKSVRKKGWLAEHGSNLKGISANHDKLEYLFEFMDGFKDNGVWWSNAFKPITEATNKELEMQEYFVTKLEELFNRHYTKAERRSWLEKVDTEFDIDIDKSSIMAMALNFGNEYNREALYEGIENQKDWNINRFQIDKILDDHMQTKDWHAVQEIWDLIDELWVDVAKQEKQLTGVTPKKVEPTPFTNKHGSFRGGYYPIEFDREKGQLAKDRADRADTQDLMETTWRLPMTRHDHTLARTNSGKQFVKLDMNLISRHIMTVIHDVSFRVPVMEINRLLKQSELRDLIVEHVGQEGYDQIKPWLQGIANDIIVPENGLQEYIRKGRHSASIVSMGLKLSTALMQPFGLTQSIILVGAKWIGKGVNYSTQHPIQAKREAFAKSTFLRNRSKTFDRDVRDVLGRLTGQDTKLKKFQQQQFILIAIMDMAVSLPTWHGAYMKAISEGMSEKDAIAMGDMAVRKSQGSGGPQDLAKIQRGSETWKMWTAFYSYFSTLWQILKRTQRMRKYRKISSFQAATNFLLAVTIPAIFTELMMGRGPDDDEEFWVWAIQQQFIYPAYSVIGLREFSGFLDEPRFGIGSPVSDILKTIGRTLIRTKELAFDEDAKDFNKKDISTSIMFWGYLLKLPAREVNNMWRHFSDTLDGEEFNLWEFFVQNNYDD